MGYIKYAENKENKKTEESIKYEDIYESPIGKIFISCNETGLTEVSFVKEDILADRKNTANAENIESIKKNSSILTDTKRWLDIYFSGKEPGFVPSFHVSGTPFQLGVWKILQKIPYAKTVTYGEIAKEIAKEKGRFTYIPKNLFYYRIHDGATTKACLKNQEKTQEELEMFAKFWPKPVVKLLMHFYKMGYKSYEK